MKLGNKKLRKCYNKCSKKSRELEAQIKNVEKKREQHSQERNGRGRLKMDYLENELDFNSKETERNNTVLKRLKTHANNKQYKEEGVEIS